MGSEQSLSIIKSNSKFNHFQIGTMSKNKQAKNMYIKINVYSQSNDLTPFLALQQHRSQIYNSSYLFIPKFVRVIHDGLCNDSVTALFASQTYDGTLYDEIQNRSTISRYYSHEEIWYLMLVLTKTAYQIHSDNKKWIVGNLHPKNIMIDDDGQIKIICVNSLPYEYDHFVTYKTSGIQNAFTSPQTLGFLYKSQNNKFPDCVDKQKSESFTLGMTMLAMCNLNNDLSDIYDTSYYFKFPQRSPERNTNNSIIESAVMQSSRSSNYNNSNYNTSNHNKSNHNTSFQQPHSYSPLLNNNLITKSIDMIKNRYCYLLGAIIHRLLAPDPNNRLSIVELYEGILTKNQGYVLGMDLGWIPESGNSSPVKNVNNNSMDVSYINRNYFGETNKYAGSRRRQTFEEEYSQNSFQLHNSRH